MGAKPQVLRNLIDTINLHFAVFMNFTFAEAEVSTIELLLGKALWTRINAKIRFTELNRADALAYCHQLINHYQIDKKKKNVPFSTEHLQLIFDLIPSEKLIPIEINRYCSNVLNLAIETDASEISRSLIEKSFEEMAVEE